VGDVDVDSGDRHLFIEPLPEAAHGDSWKL
jgi:hypothetical protein